MAASNHGNDLSVGYSNFLALNKIKNLIAVLSSVWFPAPHGCDSHRLHVYEAGKICPGLLDLIGRIITQRREVQSIIHPAHASMGPHGRLSARHVD